MAISVAVCVGDEVADKLVNDLRTEIAGILGAGMDADEPHGAAGHARAANKVLVTLMGRFRGSHARR